jgi:pimeloyl-ACP methyl ester carboxylesterase
MQFFSWYENGNKSILFIHSLFSAEWEWAPTILHLKDNSSFHMIAPALEPSDFLDLDKCVSLLAHHIKKVGKGGRAHVVGLSIGAHITLHLSKIHPEVIQTLVLSGYNDFSPLLRPIAPLVIYLASRGNNKGTSVPMFSVEESRAIFRIVSSPPSLPTKSIRTVIIAGLLKDSSKCPVTLKEAMIDNRQDKRVDIIGFLQKRHLWNRRDGKGFGKMLIAWDKDGEQWTDYIKSLHGQIQD